MDYLRLSHLAHMEGIINDETLFARLKMIFLEDDENTFFDDNAEKFFGGEPCEQRLTDKLEVRAAQGGLPPLMEFQLPSQSPQAGWIFSISDTDPLPSIPHGHWQTHKNQRKLDPYLGLIYEGRNPTGERLPWRECNRFWRSRKFRDFAKAALEAAIADPRMNAVLHINSRGVTDPQKLPR